MAGHSKWSKVKRIKEIKDVKKSSLLTKASRDIFNAVKIGLSGDPDFNPLLKIAIQSAKIANLPGDRIEKAIKTALGEKEEGSITQTKVYEFLGPNQENILVELETDNSNRTLFELRTWAYKHNFKILPEGSISWKFETHGQILIENNNKFDIEQLLLDIMSCEGVEDVQVLNDSCLITTTKDFLKQTVELLANINNVKIKGAGIIREALTKIRITDKNLDNLKSFKEELERNFDIINIWSNLIL